MHRRIFSLALLSIPLSLSACATDDDMMGGAEGILEGTSDGMTSDTAMTTEGTTGVDTEDTEGTTEGEGCNAESPYMGGWDIGCCQDEVVQNGWSPGNISPGTILPDWVMQNQYGEDTRVYDFCHDAIYFEYSAVW